MNVKTLFKRFICASTLAAATAASAAMPPTLATLAGHVSVWPITVTLSPDRRIATFTVENQSPEVTTFQVQPETWSQPFGRNRLTPAAGMIASPALFRLAPGAAQVVRVGWMSAPAPSKTEQSYRISFRELPPPPTLLPEQTGGPGVHILLNMSVPLFIAPASPAAANVSWTVVRASHGLTLTAINKGHVHARITTVSLDGHELAGLWYLLPGTLHSWTFHNIHVEGGALALRVDTEQGVIAKSIVPSAGLYLSSGVIG